MLKLKRVLTILANVLVSISFKSIPKKTRDCIFYILMENLSTMYLFTMMKIIFLIFSSKLTILLKSYLFFLHMKYLSDGQNFPHSQF
jgi:hypothetical protein